MFTSSVLLALLLAQSTQEVTVEQVRVQTRSMLQSMCGEQCDVVGVKIKKRPKVPLGAIEPGFDDAPRTAQTPTQIALTLLFDSKLEPAYRRFVADRVKQRIGELGLPVLVTKQVRAFPSPPPDPTPPSFPQTPQAPQPQPIVIQQPPAPAPVPAPKIDLTERLMLRMIEAVPLLLLFGLLAWLVLRVLRRMEHLALDVRAPLEDDASVTLTPELIEDGQHSAHITLPPPTRDALRSDLELHRGSTRRIYRRLLLAGEHDTVARSVAVLGDFVVRDLAHDPEVRGALKSAGARTSHVLKSPMTEEDKEELLRNIQAELIADRVAHRADDVRDEFLDLLAWGPEAFAAMMGRLDPRLGLVMLRHAPAHLTEAYLTGLTADIRAQTVRQMLDAPSAEPEEIDALAQAISDQARAALVGGYEADHIVDLIDGLSAKEQDEMVSTLETTRPDYVRRNLGQLPIESALLRVPDEALEAAWGSVSLEDWVHYLRLAPAGIRTRALGTCPNSIRAAVQDELGLRVSADQHKAAEARRKIVQVALDAERNTRALVPRE